MDTILGQFDISTNGTAGWYCEDCHKFFDEPWYSWEHEEDALNNTEDFILNKIDDVAKFSLTFKILYLKI
jgi:hypothetical protein